MRKFDGRLRLLGEHGPGVGIHIDLNQERLHVTSGTVEIGNWDLKEVLILAKEDGFHLRAEGEEVVLTTDDDPGFAVAVGVRNAPPLLRRQISERMRSPGPDL